MSSNVREFTVGLRKFAEKDVPGAVKELRDAVSLEAHRGVVLMSPVDTSRLRSNWSVGTPSPGDGYDDGKRDPSGMQTLAEGATVVEGATNPFAPIHLWNAVPYAVHVNDGTARTRAVRMVEATVARIRRMFR